MKNGSANNALSKSHSPYLLQHAQNPVHWQPWSDETLALAQTQNKPLLVSIGYAACHWCHVMAHETFEDEASARIMNEHFICIKVDREERPDIDAIYMQAVQMMTGSGGWPLHVFALPDGRPFFGGTYFPRDQWQQLVRAAAHEYHHNYEKVSAYAENLEKGMRVSVPVISSPSIVEFGPALMTSAAQDLQDRFDQSHGGFLGAPKFPMPTLLNFLHDYSLLAQDDTIEQHIHTTLKKMSLGGIYDHIGGGFARYSVDSRWKVPHFEKMLYDNAQLLSLLSKMYRVHPSQLTADRIRETADFLLRDLKTKQGLFASSLDADSEGVEGKFYVWDEQDLRQVLGDLFPTARALFSVDQFGYWENNTYILQMKEDLELLAGQLRIPLKTLRQTMMLIKQMLFQHRQQRTPPALDGKALTSWNALAIEGLTNAALALADDTYLTAAQTTAIIILEKMRMEDGGLYHVYHHSQAYTPGFLEDYSHMISALIALYQADLDQNWLHHARSLLQYVYDHFLDEESGFFYFTADSQSALVKRDIDLTDGVIPSANSVLGHNLFALSRYFDEPGWEAHARKMAGNMKDELARYPGSYGNWASLYLQFAYPFHDVSILGENAQTYLSRLQSHYQPNRLFAGAEQDTPLPILQDRTSDHGTRIFVCKDKVCQQPFTSIEAALASLKIA